MNFQELRSKYRKLVFSAWQKTFEAGKLDLTFDYLLLTEAAEKLSFRHQLSFKLGGEGEAERLAEASEQLDGMIFNIGLVEAINYWKLACPAEIELACGSLTTAQQAFWRKLIYKGLGEFIYLNRLHLPEVAGFELNQDNIVKFTTTSEKSYPKVKFEGLSGNLIPVGGGKDSVVTLEVLRGEANNLPMLMSAPVAAYDCVRVAGYDQYLEIERRLDPQILELNQRGFLNGHVPFSAILAFISVVGAALTGKARIVLSNENSANEASVPGTDFNHQYSKSVEFEADFRAYLAEFVTESLDYFSLLRPLEELEIARLFSHYSQYHQLFRSCNVGKKSNTWCGHCPKCLFVFVMLVAFLDYEQVVAIFAKDLLNDESLLLEFRQLLGLEETKPFECVGTVSEMRRAMKLLIARNYPPDDIKNADLSKKRPILLQKFIEYELDDVELDYDEQNFVPTELLEKLQAEREACDV